MPVVSAKKLRAQNWERFVLEHRRKWCPSKLPQLVRLLRVAGFYSAETRDRFIMRALTRHIAKRRVEGAGYRRRQTELVARHTPEWSRLLFAAKPYRKHSCRSSERLRAGIRLLCTAHPLSSADLGELLHRSHTVLMKKYLLPMVKAGELKFRLQENKAGSRNRPSQGYHSTSDGGVG